LAPAVIGGLQAFDKAVGLEAPEQLRGRRRRDGCLARELGTDDVSFCDRLEREVLGRSQGRLVRCQQTLDPPARHRGDTSERCGRLLAGV